MLFIVTQSLIGGPYRFLNEEGVVSVTGAIVAIHPKHRDLNSTPDFLPRQPSNETTKPLLHWLIRRVEVTCAASLH
jgi:hypothetical protein